MFDFFNCLNTTDKIQILAICSSSLISIVSIFIAVATLRQTNKISVDANRAYIVFYIESNRSDAFNSLVIKNFGNTSGRLLDLSITPKLCYQKSFMNFDSNTIADYKGIYFAPGQSIKSIFSFKDYPDKEFEISITYETCQKIYTENYKIDIRYKESLFKGSTSVNTQFDVLKNINESIREVSDKLS